MVGMQRHQGSSYRLVVRDLEVQHGACRNRGQPDGYRDLDRTTLKTLTCVLQQAA